MDNIDNFEHPSLPLNYTFCSNLRLSGTIDASSQHALDEYNEFKCSKFLDYHM